MKLFTLCESQPAHPKTSHLCEVHWLSGVVGLRSLLEHGRMKGTTTKRKSAKSSTMTTTTTTGVNVNTFAIVRSGNASYANWGHRRALLGTCGKPLGALLGRSWGPLGALLELSWGSLGGLGGSFAPSWRPSIKKEGGFNLRTPLGSRNIASWGPLGPLLGRSWALLGHF